MMDSAIRAFPKQFEYQPVVLQGGEAKQYSHILVCGMGGSHLAADVFKQLRPAVSLTIHSDYGLPPIAGDPSEALVVAISYSGNTEETLSGFEEALKRGIPLFGIAKGGTLVERAKEAGVPYILIPDTGIQPRMALGFILRALAKAIGDEALLSETAKLTTALRVDEYETRGKELAAKLNGRVPVVYASERNRALALNWKIKFNETGKIPAFYNVFPELNHNEMNGFDRGGDTKSLSEQFCFLLLTDPADHPQIQKRMAVLEKLYRDRESVVQRVPITGATEPEQIFSSLLTADWAAYHLGEGYHIETEQVPMVEEFKRLIA